MELGHAGMEVGTLCTESEYPKMEPGAVIVELDIPWEESQSLSMELAPKAWDIALHVWNLEFQVLIYVF